MKMIPVWLSVKDLRALDAICAEGGCTHGAYLLQCLRREVASRKESGWSPARGWDGRKEAELLREAHAVISSASDSACTPCPTDHKSHE